MAKKSEEKSKTVNPKGRKYANAAALRKAVDKYFDECDKKGVLYGEGGLALSLDVSLHSLRNWYDGLSAVDLQETTEYAYLRIMSQIETDPRYQEKGGMSTRAIFLLKQKMLGGYQDKAQVNTDVQVDVKMGEGMDKSDFQ